MIGHRHTTKIDKLSEGRHVVVGSLPTRAYAMTMRHTLWPLMNFMSGRTIHHKMKFLQESQWWSHERLQQLQLRKLQRLMMNVYERVPFYRREMRKRGLQPEDFTTFEALDELPLVTKAMLKSDPTDFLADGTEFHQLVKNSTGGSTAQPTVFYRSREQDSWHWAIKYRIWGMAGYELGLPYINIYNMHRRGLKKQLQDFLLRNRHFYFFADANQEEVLAAVLKNLSKRSVQYLAGCTTTLRVVADYRATLRNAPPIHLRAVLSTGSLLTQRDRNIIETHLVAPVWDHYGLGGEGVHIAAECEHKQGYHINIENMIIQPGDPQTMGTGEPSEIYLTQLDNFEWPLIRYVTGDRAVFTTRHCRCGRGLPLLERIDGRVSEVLKLPNGVRLNIHYFSVLMGAIDDISQYQVEQLDRNRLLFRIIWRDHSPSCKTKKWIESKVRRIASNTVQVDFEDLREIQFLPSGKHQFLITLQEQDNEC